MAKMIARQDFRYGDKQLKVGDEFDANRAPDDPDVLTKIGRARRASQDAEQGADEEPAATKRGPGRPRKDGTYRRSDMRAEG